MGKRVHSRLFLQAGILIITLFLLTVKTGKGQDILSKGRVSGDFGFDGMFYIPDSLISAEEVDSKVRGNAYMNLLYTNGGLSAGLRYEFYLFPLIDMEEIGYRGQGITYYFAEYRNDFLQVTGGTFYEQFGNGLTFRAYEDRRLGVDNSLLGGRVKLTPYRGITMKGVWGIERKNFDFNYSERNDYVRGLDLEVNFADIFPVMAEKNFSFGIGGSFVSKFEKTTGDYYFTLHPDIDSLSQTAMIPANKIPQNVATWGARAYFGYKGFRIEGEYARKINDPNATNSFIYKPGDALFLSATYSMKGFGVSASFIRADNMDYRSNRMQKENSLLYINYIPAINRQYAYQLISNYSYASQPNGQIGAQLQINYRIPRNTKIGGKWGTDITFNYSRFHNIKQDTVSTAIENGTMTGTLGYSSPFFKFGPELLYQDVGLEISRRVHKNWKLILAYNYISYNLYLLQGHEDMFYGHNVSADLTYKINTKHALRLELQHLASKQDYGSWLYAMLEYSINPHWFFSISDQWNYGNEDPVMRKIWYFNISATYVIKTTRIALNFGKTREGILCVGGVCRAVPASYGLGLSVTTSF